MSIAMGKSAQSEVSARLAHVRAQLGPIRSRSALLDSYRRESLYLLAVPTLGSDAEMEILDLAYALRWAELEGDPDPAAPIHGRLAGPLDE